MSKMHLGISTSLVIAITGIGMTGHANNLYKCIDVGPGGKFVERSITVKLKKGGLLPDLDRLDSYNPATRSILIFMNYGQIKSYNVEDIEEIIFERRVRSMSQAVQQQPWKIISTISEPFLVEIPLINLKLENSYIGYQNASGCFTQERIRFEVGEQASVHEVKKIQFDPGAGIIMVQGELVQYEVKPEGPPPPPVGAGAIGATKKQQ